MYSGDDSKILLNNYSYDTYIYEERELIIIFMLIFSDSGRQQWLFTLVEGKTDVYNIVVGGRSGCNTFLSVQGCPSNYVTLQGGDDRK